MPPIIDPTKLGYRPCVGVMLINSAGRVWVGQRADMPGDAEGRGEWWQMPQGGIDEGEDPQEAAMRELYEETSVRSAEIIGQTEGWLRYDLPEHLIGIAWGGRWRGQKQRWFAMRFQGSDDEIDISAPPGHKPEFVSWQWAAADELVDRIVPFKREVYRAVVAELGVFAAPG
ncbi:MAG: RNA pyrophosphohydrolase [Hyphomicrobium sp.]|nr:RNA pyrophosphohydrolase [Hyphomicrobium sp.]